MPNPYPVSLAPITAPIGKVRSYVVQAGDTPDSIAKHFYHNGQEYLRIWRNNRQGSLRANGTMGVMANPHVVEPGMVLLLP